MGSRGLVWSRGFALIFAVEDKLDRQRTPACCRCCGWHNSDCNLDPRRSRLVVTHVPDLRLAMRRTAAHEVEQVFRQLQKMAKTEKSVGRDSRSRINTLDIARRRCFSAFACVALDVLDGRAITSSPAKWRWIWRWADAKSPYCPILFRAFTTSCITSCVAMHSSKLADDVRTTKRARGGAHGLDAIGTFSITVPVRATPRFAQRPLFTSKIGKIQSL